jgi:hypothetical protein
MTHASSSSGCIDPRKSALEAFSRICILRLPINEIEGAAHNGVRSHQRSLPIYALVEGRSVTKSITHLFFRQPSLNEMEGAAHSGVRSYQRPLPIYPLIEGITDYLF